MRFGFIVCAAFFSLSYFIVVGCNAEDQGSSQQASPLAAAETSTATETPSVKAFAPLGGAKKPTSAPLGGPKKSSSKPKFALKNMTPTTGAGANAPDRAAEVKRLTGAYNSIAIRYADGLTLATTPEEKEALAPHAPSARALRPIAVLLIHLVAADPQDEPALEALTFLCKYVGVSEIDEALADSEVDPHALLLEYHADNPKIIDALRRLPRGDAADAFLRSLFEKTFNPDVRWSAGAQLISSLRRNGRTEEIEPLVITMAEDRYLEGVPVGGKSNAREWAMNKLREIRTLGIGQVLPEVSGDRVEGGTGQITDYRGKVVVLDVWTTWCGPCVSMITHEVEMVERLKDRPFALLSVSCDSDKETLEEFLEGTSMPWDHWWVGPDSQFKKTLNIASYPTVYVLDGEGVIRHKNMKGEELETAVEALLEELEASATEPQS
ncbi:MAG: redoxin domain-containing protein [Aeoliella sp.]